MIVNEVSADGVRYITAELEEAQSLLSAVLADTALVASIQKMATAMVSALSAGHKIIACGNGGSHCDAMHFAEELSGRYRAHRPALAALAISDASHITCTGNDYGFDYIFSRYVEGLGQTGDVLFALSTSGKSPNILEAAKAAKAKGMAVCALTGKDGGPLAALADVEVRVPHFGYADRIQEIHIKVIHILISLIEREMGYAR